MHLAIEYVNNGGRLDRVDVRGDYILHSLLRLEVPFNRELVCSLLCKGVDFNLRNRSGKCAIHLAVELDNLPFLAFCVDWNRNK